MSVLHTEEGLSPRLKSRFPSKSRVRDPRQLVYLPLPPISPPRASRRRYLRSPGGRTGNRYTSARNPARETALARATPRGNFQQQFRPGAAAVEAEAETAAAAAAETLPSRLASSRAHPTRGRRAASRARKTTSPSSPLRWRRNIASCRLVALSAKRKENARRDHVGGRSRARRRVSL